MKRTYIFIMVVLLGILVAFQFVVNSRKDDMVWHTPCAPDVECFPASQE